MDARGAGEARRRLAALARRARPQLPLPHPLARPRDAALAALRTDPLTGLGDRTLLAQQVRRGTPRGTVRGLLLLDLDGFKQVNDALGHVAGDTVLREVARRVRTTADPQDTVVRLGGDEFAVLTAPLPTTDAVGRVADALLAALAAPVRVDGVDLAVSASLGTAVEGRDGIGLEQLLRAADQAMYAAKRAARAHRDARPGAVAAGTDAGLVADLADALERAERGGAGAGGLLLHYQPQVDWAGEVAGYEALVRWQHPERGLLVPRQFLPAAERAGLLGRVTLVALDRALADQAHLPGTGGAASADGQVGVSVNVSARDLLTQDLLPDVAALLERHGVAPGLLTLEVAEPSPHPMPVVRALLSGLAELGVRVSVHGFGTGHASLTALAQHRGVREVKIDPVLVRAVVDDEEAARLVRALVSAAHGLGVEVVAEGVGGPEVLAHLRDLGCDRLQGQWLGGPVDVLGTRAWRRRWATERELRLAL